MSRMDLTARFLCSNIQGAKLAYTQSDEISILMTDFDSTKTEAWYDGNIQKIVSVSASMASAFFNSIPSGKFGTKVYGDVAKHSHMDVNDWVLTAETNLAVFDARVFVIPDKVEVANYFHWRTTDWERNSIQMLARYHYPQSELHGKGWAELHEMIHKAGDNWSKYPDAIKRGRLCSTHIGDMWSTIAMPDLHTEDGKNMLLGLIPNHGY
jgi:tRNA(His) 5'-end guanylyltransferase